MLLGDGEMAEGSVWEAADVALYHKLDNLCGIIDVNGLGQSRPTQFEPSTWTQIAARWNAFGWHTLVVDGHDIEALLDAFAAAKRARKRPADDDPGADAQGQGRLVRRRQGRLARQGVQEGRGGRQGASPS